MLLIILALLIAYAVFGHVLDLIKAKRGDMGEGIGNTIFAFLVSVVTFFLVLTVWGILKWVVILYMTFVVIDYIYLCLNKKIKWLSHHMIAPIIFAVILLFWLL